MKIEIIVHADAQLIALLERLIEAAVAVLEARRTPVALLWSRGVWQLVIAGEAQEKPDGADTR